MNTLLRYPVKNPTIAQPFGFDNTNNPQRKTFYTLFDNKHPGVDFSLPVCTPISAAYPGIVVRNEFHSGMGNVVASRHGNITVLYAHLSRSLVQLGQILTLASPIGLSGDTGKACLSPHLHFELRDLTQPTLKDMVFDPPFNHPIKRHLPTFTYTVNNQNTTKTLVSLSHLYFGTDQYWSTIRRHNPSLAQLSKHSPLPSGTPVTIPNYTKT